MAKNFFTAHTNNLAGVNGIAAFCTTVKIGKRLIIRKCHHESCCWQLALAVNAHIQDVFGVKFKIQPRTAVRNNAGSEQQFARCMGFATVMVEKHTG